MSIHGEDDPGHGTQVAKLSRDMIGHLLQPRRVIGPRLDGHRGVKRGYHGRLLGTRGRKQFGIETVGRENRAPQRIKPNPKGANLVGFMSYLLVWLVDRRCDRSRTQTSQIRS